MAACSDASSGTDPNVAQDNAGGYCVPMSYAWDGGDHIYFHCAPEGEKLRHLARSGDVCFCVVGATQVLPSKFSTLYESVLVFGRIDEIHDSASKMAALGLLLDKYSPDDKPAGLKYSEKSLHRTKILRLAISRISGKSKEFMP